MEKIIIFFFTNLSFIFSIIFVFGFVLPIILNVIRIKKIKSDGEILTEKTILIESQLSLNIFLKLFLLIFALVGLFIIYVGTTTTDILFNKVMAIIFGSIFVFIPLIILINLTIRCKRILKGDYVIIEDILMDKERIINHSTDNGRNEDWFYLFFEKYFKKYNKRILVNSRIFNSSKVGDKFYIVFTKTDYFVFNANDYRLINRDKVISIDELVNHIKIKEFKIKELDDNSKEIKIINKSRIKDDFTKIGHRKTALIFIACCVGMLALLYLSIFIFKNVIAIIVLSITTCFWLFLTFVKVKYVYDIYKNIRKGNYRIKEDEVISLNNQLQFKDSNEIISFKFQNYKKIVYADRKENYNAKIGDKYYLVFVKGEKEPIKVYNVKNSILEDNN